jgi:hypothetical protein
VQEAGGFGYSSMNGDFVWGESGEFQGSFFLLLFLLYPFLTPPPLTHSPPDFEIRKFLLLLLLLFLFKMYAEELHGSGGGEFISQFIFV